MKKVLLLGSGGREDAIAWKLSRSENVDQILVVPGNPAMNRLPKLSTKSGKITNAEMVISIAKDFEPDLIIIGPEQPIVVGISDALRAEGFSVAAPSQAAGQLEESKIFSKIFMTEFNIPTAAFTAHDSYEDALSGLENWDFSNGIVIKSDALAGGKGVVLCDTKEEAETVVFDFMKNPKVRVKTNRILFEHKLKGKEVSAFAALDGENIRFIGTACDYKRVYDGDLGPNTGGMGTYTPQNWPSKDVMAQINSIFQKVSDGMQSRGTPYQGVLFAGLMIDKDEANIIEFNIRFGDPETQVLMPTLDDDLYELLSSTAKGQLSQMSPPRPKTCCAVHVVLASGGYPSIDDTPIQTGHPITLPTSLPADQIIFYAGVNGKDPLFNSGGRVLGVTATAETIESARLKAYETVHNIRFEGMQFRNDIGLLHA